MRFLAVLLGTIGTISAGLLTSAPALADDEAGMAAEPAPPVGPHGKPLYYFMVFSNAKPGEDAEFERWYDEIHAPIMIESSDFVWAQRFELSPVQFGGGVASQFPTRQTLVVFAVETDDIEAVVADAERRMRMPRNISSRAMDYRSLLGVTYMASSPMISQAEAQRVLAQATTDGRIVGPDVEGPPDIPEDLPPPPERP